MTLPRHAKPSAAEAEPRRLAPPSALLWLVLAALGVAIAFPALSGRDASRTDNSVPGSPLQVPAAANANDPAVPTETGAPVAPTSTSIAQPTNTVVGSATVVATPNLLTPQIATHVAYATNVAQFREHLRTEVALTHAPTITPGRPQARSSPTPMMGMLPGCGNTSPHGPQAVSCWRGVVNGQVVEVYAGREWSEGDRTQGIVRVHVRGQQGQGDGVYQTPDRVGAVGIASVNGTEFTLETVDQPTPQVFVFDLATRSWVP